ncbi:MAG: MFS transporter, partial [Candidatus Puniceispirillales bacterium]
RAIYSRFSNPNTSEFIQKVVQMELAEDGVAFASGMGAVFASKIGMSLTQVSYFMVAIGGGAMILQYPIGKLSDLIDRRTVILIAHSLSLGFLIASYYASSISFLWLGLMMALYSGVSTPLYSLYIAHANDYLSPRQVVSTSAKLVMINGLGAIFGPPVLGYSIYLIGVSAFFSVQIIMHIIMIGFVFYRMYARESMPLEAQGPFVAVRGTSVASSLLPEAEWDGREDDDKTGNVNLT